MIEREIIRDMVTREQYDGALKTLPELLTGGPDLQDYSFATEMYNVISRTVSSFNPVRIAVLRSFTLEPILPILSAKLYQAGFLPQIYFGGYNQVQQEILNSDSELFRFKPDIIILALRLHELQPELVHSFLALGAESVGNAVREVSVTLRSLVQNIRHRTDAAVIFHNFEIPLNPSLGILDAQHPTGQRKIIRALNDELAKLCEEFSCVYMLDYDYLQSVSGKAEWFDRRMWYLAKMPVSRKAMISLADTYVTYIQAIRTARRKCVVLDADNTLWGGIIGEDGLDGIKLGPDYPGSAYVDFQRSLLNLYHRGIILALNSKNNLTDVLDVFNNHPFMVLRPEHFATMQVNWNSKPENMKTIAAELNIGIDSFVFIDDSSFECEMMRRNLPQIMTVPMPAEPAEYTSVISNLSCFETTSYTPEDRARGLQYRAKVQCEQLKVNSSSLEDFYRSLEMRLTIGMANAASISRIAQMTQKTNQFNLTTRRYSEGEIARFASSADTAVYWQKLEDRFGDHGIIGAIIVRKTSEQWDIDTFLMSCRVIGRTVEHAVLTFLVRQAKHAGAKRIIGEYIPTGKNTLVKDFFPKHNFRQIKADGDCSLWELSAGDIFQEYPEWFKMVIELEEK